MLPVNSFFKSGMNIAIYNEIRFIYLLTRPIKTAKYIEGGADRTLKFDGYLI